MRNLIDWSKTQLTRNARVVKYGIVGGSGVVVNLVAIALLYKITAQKTWVASALANVIATINNFVFHNLWTFSDRRHRGLRVIGGFLSYGFTAIIGICVMTAAFAGLTQIAARLPLTRAHAHSLLVVLACQFIAVILGAGICYLLNVKYTWADSKSVPVEAMQADGAAD